MRKKVAIVGTAGLPAAYGGFETLAQNLVTHLGDRYDFTVYCKRTPRDKRHPTFSGARLVYLPFHSNGWESLPYDIVSLLHAFSTMDVVLYLGPVAGMILPLNRVFRKNLIVNFGGLNEWEREKLHALEKKYMFASCWLCARFATETIADNVVLQQSIKRSFGTNSVIIRYGGDHVSLSEDHVDLEASHPFVKEPYFVSVARAQIDNNLHVLIDAFKELPEKRLVLVSNWSVSRYGREMYEKAQSVPNIVPLPAIYDPREIDYVRSRAKAYIHSHSHCGTAPSLVEAICLGLPIISWDVPTNRETTKGHALFFDSMESLMNIVRDVTPGELARVKEELSTLATEEYTWKRVCEQYANLFDQSTVSDSSN
jgi:glycosyltransferase involved in cell wall biosynthesis